MTLVLLGALLVVQTPPEPPAASPSRPGVNYEADEPPPSSWDRQRTEGEGGSNADQGVSLVSQLGRTFLALLFVIGLIYLFARFALPKLLAIRPVGKAGKVLTVVERVPVDAKNALVVVDVASGPRLLFSSGEKGMQLVGDMAALGGKQASPERTFGDAMARAQERADEEESGHA